MLKKNVPKVSTSKCTSEYSTPNCHQNKCYHCNGLEQCQTMQHCKLKKLDAVMSFFFFLQVAGHTARCPENPWGRESRLWCMSPHKCHDCSTSMITTPRRKKKKKKCIAHSYCAYVCVDWPGYPQEEDGERPAGAADSDRRALWAEEERGRGADWSQR